MVHGVQLPAGTAISSVHLSVADGERSRAFYSGMLGLPTQMTGESSTDQHDDGRALVRLSVVPGATRRPEGVTGLYHFAVLYPDRGSAARVLQRLIDVRWPFTGFADHGVSEAAYLLDPDGIGVELYVDRPREVWPRSPDGRLTMYTRPLDIEDLLAQAEHPVSTDGDQARIGHVHFHVADTGRSTEFYSRVVGFDVILDAIPGAVFMSAGGYHHHLGVNTWARGRTADPTAANLVDWRIRVPGDADRAALIQRLEAARAHRDSGAPGEPVPAEKAGEPTVARTGGPAAFLDPDGVLLIVEDETA